MKASSVKGKTIRAREILNGLRSTGGIVDGDIRPYHGWRWATERPPQRHQRKPKPTWMACRISQQRRAKAAKTR